MRKHINMNRSGNGTYENCKFSPYAEIFDSPKIVDSLIYGGQIFDKPNILNSSISGYARVSGRSMIRHSHISGTAQVAGFAKIIDSVVAGNAVITKDSMVFESEVMDNIRILDSGVVKNCIVKDFAMVTGTGIVEGTRDNPVVLEGHDYVCEGRWNRKPITFISSSGFIVNESIGRNVVIHCINKPIDKWLQKNGRAGRLYAEKLGLDKYHTDELEYLLEQMLIIKNQKDYGNWFPRQDGFSPSYKG